MMSRRVVYVAGPYSSDPVGNTRTACQVFHRLFDAGLAPIIPHLSLLLDFEQHRPWQDWMDLDLPIVERCEALLRIPGASAGADLEVQHAIKCGIPVFYQEADIIAWANA